MRDRQALVASVDLADLADELLGPGTPGPAGTIWLCPDDGHASRSNQPPECVIYTTRRSDQRWQCTSCGAGGTAVELLTCTRGLTIGTALDHIADRLAAAGRPVPVTGAASPSDRSADEATMRRLHHWVEAAAERLWTPDGEPVLRWLTGDIGYPEDLLRLHRIGATSVTDPSPLATRRAVAGGRRPEPAVVLPIRRSGTAVRAQLRPIEASDCAASYADAPALLGDRSPIGLFRPMARRHDEVIVTANVLDALAANVAGYRSAVVCGPAPNGLHVAVQLARIEGRLVLAMPAERHADAHRLLEALDARRHAVVALHIDGATLTDRMATASNWPRKFGAHVDQAIRGSPGPAIERF